MRPGQFHNIGPRSVRAGGFVYRGAKKLGVRVINKTGSAIVTDQLVALLGFDTTTKLPKIVLADADLAFHSNLYVTASAVANNGQGYVYKGGLSAATLNTNTATAVGDPVYLSATAGGFTPTTASLITPHGASVVGYVVVKSATVGQILWHIEERGTKVGIVIQSRQRFTTAALNTGVTVVAAPGADAALRLIDCAMIAIGANAATATSVDLVSTQATASVKLVANAIAGLTRGAVLRAGQTANSVVLQDGASFVANDANAAITASVTTNNLATATAVDIILTYAIDPV
jgi:hypothetical protein